MMTWSAIFASNGTHRQSINIDAFILFDNIRTRRNCTDGFSIWTDPVCDIIYYYHNHFLLRCRELWCANEKLATQRRYNLIRKSTTTPKFALILNLPEFSDIFVSISINCIRIDSRKCFDLVQIFADNVTKLISSVLLFCSQNDTSRFFIHWE